MDSIIPVEMSYRLAKAAGGRLVAQEVYEQAGHDDSFEVRGDRLHGHLELTLQGLLQ